MERLAGRLGLGVMAALSVAVASFSFRLVAAPWDVWIVVDSAIRDVMTRVPLPMLAHAVFAATALLVGPFQFFGGLRRRRPGLHRATGRVYVTACVLAGMAALCVVPFASGGPVAGFGFGLLAVCWIATTIAAWRAATRRDFERHRALMRYSFAMTFAAVTLRLQIPLGIALFGFPDYATLSPYLSFTAWLPNVLAVWAYVRLTASATNVARGVSAEARAGRRQ
jgi:uncharacterized membrane protein